MFTIGRLDIGIRTRGAGTPPVPAAPVSTSAPAITGSPLVGSSLSCSTGGWTGFPAPTFTYQWIWADTSANISGATSSTYTPVSGDLGHTLKCAVTATNSQGNATANSNTTAAVAALPANTVAPAVTGTTTVGQTLSTTNGTWSNTPTSYAYQWKWADTGANISGATAATYVLVSGDVGHTIKCTVTATNAAGSASADSNTTAAVTAGVTPAFQADFTSLSALPTGVSFSRATGGTYFDASGVLQTAAIDAPRFDHAWNGSAWVATGLLIEEQRTNLLKDSGDQTTANWGTGFCSITTSATTGADNSSFMKLVRANSGSGIKAEFFNNAAVVITSGASHALSIDVKKTNWNYIWVAFQSDTSGHWVCIVVDLSTNAVTQTGVGGSSGTLVGTPTVTLLRNGIVRVKFIAAQFTTTGYISCGFAAAATGNSMSSGGGDITVTLAGTETFLTDAAQLSPGGTPTSYIPTTTAAVTRSADIAQLTGAAAAAAAAAAGSLLVEANALSNSLGSQVSLLGSMAGNGSIHLYYFSSGSNAIRSYSSSAGPLSDGSVADLTGQHRGGVCWDATGRSVVVDGGTVATDTNDSGFSGASSFQLGGASVLGSAVFSAWFRSIGIYSSRLSDADLQTKSVVGASF